MRYKTRKVRREVRAVVQQMPPLSALLGWVDQLAWELFRKEITVTSIHRTDGTVHETWRAADCRVRQEWHDDRELSWDEWETLVKRINRKFIYGVTRDGRPTVCAHLLRKGERGSTEDHVHIQVPSGRWMGQREA